MGIVFFFFPYVLLRMFTTDDAVIDLGTVFLKIVALLQIPLALTMVLAGSLRGAGDTDSSWERRRRHVGCASTHGAGRVPVAGFVGVVCMDGHDRRLDRQNGIAPVEISIGAVEGDPRHQGT